MLAILITSIGFYQALMLHLPFFCYFVFNCHLHLFQFSFLVRGFKNLRCLQNVLQSNAAIVIST